MYGLNFARKVFSQSVFAGAGSAFLGAVSGGFSAAIGSVVTNLVGSDHDIPEAIKTAAAGTAVVVGSTTALYAFLSASGLKDKAVAGARSCPRERSVDDFKQPTKKEMAIFFAKVGVGFSTAYSIVQLVGGLVGFGLREEDIWPMTLAQVETDIAIGTVVTCAAVLGSAIFFLNHVGALDDKNFASANETKMKL